MTERRDSGRSAPKRAATLVRSPRPYRLLCRALGPGHSLNGKQLDVVVGEPSVDRDEREPI